MVCGKGANGGDGRIAAGLLGAEVVRPGEASTTGADVVVDALLGTGFRGAPRPEAARDRADQRARRCRSSRSTSRRGSNASTGEVEGAAVDADVTVTMHGRKVGLAVGPGRFHAGEVESSRTSASSRARRSTGSSRATSSSASRARRERDNKYSAGSVLVVGGARGMTGAAALAARAAFRADAGYVAIAAPAEALPMLETLVVEAVKRPLEERLRRGGARVGARARPGPRALGGDEAARAAPARGDGAAGGRRRRRAVRARAVRARSAATVLTPHSGELGRLLGEDSTWVDAHRLEALSARGRALRLRRPAQGRRHAGRRARRRRLGRRHSNVAALATAGTGDVLTGIIAAFLAKGMDAREAAAAGAPCPPPRRARGPTRGLVAGDLVDALWP